MDVWSKSRMLALIRDHKTRVGKIIAKTGWRGKNMAVGVKLRVKLRRLENDMIETIQDPDEDLDLS